MTYAVMMQAIGLVFDPYVLLVILCSALFGLFVGCIPGLTATMATALLVPITFFHAPCACSRRHRDRDSHGHFLR